MGKSNLKLILALLLVTVAGIVVYSCRKSEGPPDPNATITVERKLVISALNTFTPDSIGQFSAAITSPSGTTNQVATGNTIVIKDPVAGNYSVVVSKTGYATSEAKNFTVTLPTDPKSNSFVDVTVLLSKVAPAITVSGTTGAVIAVTANSEVPTSNPVANATVAPGTVFTLADGTKPASVAISVTNIPVNTDVAPTTSIGGVATTVVSTGVEIINNQIPSQKIDLQPSGLVLSQPMIIDVYIGKDYPATMSVAEKTARQNGLTMNYVRKDGTVEVVTPDHFSADRNTVYYKITHFSQWNQSNKYVTFKPSLLKALTTSDPVTETGKCGSSFILIAQTSFMYENPVSYLLTGSAQRVKYSSGSPFVIYLGSPGFSVSATYYSDVETFDLDDSTPGFEFKAFVRLPKATFHIDAKYVPCHNQGGN